MPYRARPAAGKMDDPAQPEAVVGGIDFHQERA
jgi:hypothetical protein